jgi:hypothetical protein
MVLRSESAAIQSGAAQNSFETAAEHLSLLRKSVRRFLLEMPVNSVEERGLGVDLKFADQEMVDLSGDQVIDLRTASR